MQVLADDGARIEAHVNGRQHRNTVVLIHGFPFSSSIFDEQTRVLEREFCVVRPDLRGAGTSSSPDGPYLMETLAADVALVLDALGIQRAAIAGHSMGGYVALAFARMFTERVTRLALITSRLRTDTPEEAEARRALADRVDSEKNVELVVGAYLPRLLAPQTTSSRPQVVENAYNIARLNDAAGMAASLRGMALRAPADDIAEDLDLPVLIIAGACDAIINQEEAREIARTFPHGRLVFCPKSAHLPTLEAADCVSEALLAWLDEPVSP